jgi:diphosphate--fructose-6-phosphate 1-phosphotransferase
VGIAKKKTRIGVCFNGRQTPGGHNIISSLFDGDNCQVFGFIDGTQGLFKGDFVEIREDGFNFYRNQSGFHYLGRSADKLRSETEKEMTLTTCQKLDLDGLILVGASHTLYDALHLSEYFLVKQCKTKVVALPASIDNTVYHSQLEVSVGFSSSSHLYSTLIANLMTDASSNTKYWYFIRLMGRDPSNLALECALATHPNLVLISEEVESLGWDIEEVIGECVRVITEREFKGLGFGCIIIPEGLINSLPSIKRIVKEMDSIKSDVQEEILKKLSPWSRSKYESLPDFIQKQLREKDNTNALALSQIET